MVLSQGIANFILRYTYPYTEGFLIKSETSFHVSGDSGFIEGFEKLLIANNVAYSKRQSEPRIVIRNRTERPAKERRILHAITSEQIIDFVIKVTPAILSIISVWYGTRRKKGKIEYETEEETFEVEAQNIAKFRYTKKDSKRKTRKKRRDLK